MYARSPFRPLFRQVKKMDREFYKIRRLPPYVFAEVNAMKARARAAGHDIIDFGMGNPDFATPQHIVDKFVLPLDDSNSQKEWNWKPGFNQEQIVDDFLNELWRNPRRYE